MGWNLASVGRKGTANKDPAFADLGKSLKISMTICQERRCGESAWIAEAESALFQAEPQKFKKLGMQGENPGRVEGLLEKNLGKSLKKSWEIFEES